jgi:hypothetical protein
MVSRYLEVETASFNSIQRMPIMAAALQAPRHMNPCSLDDKTMALNNLTEEETQVVFQCLRCIATGEVILNDREFQTIFGIEFEALKEIVRLLPDIDESKEEVRLAINNSLNNLLGYPHGQHSKWSKYITVPQAEVARILSKWRGEPVGSYFRGIQ